MPLNILLCTGQPQQQKFLQPKMLVPRLKNPDVKYLTIKYRRYCLVGGFFFVLFFGVLVFGGPRV